MIVFLTWFLWIIIHKAFYCKTINNRNLWKSDWWYCLSKYLGTISKLPNLLLSFWTYKYQNGCAPPILTSFHGKLEDMKLEIFFQNHSKLFYYLTWNLNSGTLFWWKNISHSLCKCITTSEIWWFWYWLQYRLQVSTNQGFGFGIGPKPK